jgi:hypothetical protein
MTVDRLDASTIAQIRELQRERTITADEARRMLGLPPRSRVTVQLFADTDALEMAVAGIRREVHRTIRDIRRRSLR